NDDERDIDITNSLQSLEHILYPQKNLDFNHYKRQPFPHQLIGIQWILGLATEKNQAPQKGGLLADDMGLGKTFMGLAALEHFYKIPVLGVNQTKPSLIVAPLSLLENWKDEVFKTFK